MSYRISIRKNGMDPIIKYVKGSFKAAYFSEDTQDYYQNSKKAAFISFFVPFALLVYMGMMFCNLEGVCHEVEQTLYYLSAAHIASFLVVFLIAAPKFPIFFGLVYNLCRLFKSKDYFWAFVTASNWFYVVYALILGFRLSFLPGYLQPLWFLAETFYFCLVAFFLAHNVLKLPQEIAWIVPMAALFTHAIILAVTTKHGAMFVF